MKKWLTHPYWLQALITFINTGFVAILYVYFFKQHITIAELLLAEGLGSCAVALYLLFRREVSTRRDMQIAFFIFSVGLGILFLPFSRSLFFVYSILRVLGTILFYVPYNIVFFENHNKEKSLHAMTYYWIVGIVASVTGPLVGAFLFVQGGITTFVAVALLLLVGGIFYARIIQRNVYTYTPRDVVSRTTSLEAIIAVDGALHKVASIVSIFALLYFNTAFTYGGYLSFVSLFALFFMLYIAKVSDGNKKRMEFIWPLSFVLAIITALFGFLHTAGAFVFLTLAQRVCSMLVEPLRGNILLDHKMNDPVNWVSREFWLNVGRAGIFICSFLLLAINSPIAVFLFCAALHAFFPILVHYKRIYASPH